MLSIVDFDDATLKRIFSTILDWALQTAEFPANIKVGGAWAMGAAGREGGGTGNGTEAPGGSRDAGGWV